LRNILPAAPTTIKLDFETALKYVELSVPPEPIVLPWEKDYLQVTGRAEVFLVLKWLKTKEVNRVHELRVQDSLHHPHSEDDIAQLKEYYKVDVLDWRRTDISIDTLIDGAPQVKVLYLYGSGWAALSHWTGCDGVSRLKSVSSHALPF
jgi:hypothetical protein